MKVALSVLLYLMPIIKANWWKTYFGAQMLYKGYTYL